MCLAASILCADWQPVVSAARLPVLGVPVGPYLEQTEPDALLAFKRHLYLLAEAGYRIKQVPMFADISALNTLHRRLAFAEFAQEHAALYVEFATLYRPCTVEIIEIGKTVGAEELAAARTNCLTLRVTLEEAMAQADIDLWICPPAPVLWRRPVFMRATGNPDLNLPWTHAGMPAVTIPAGYAENGLPLGVQLVAKVGADELLLAWAQDIAATNALLA